MLKYLLLVLAIFLCQSAFAAEYSTIRNIQETAQPAWAPGMVIVLPDESVTIIEEELPTGDLRTSGGIVITQDGKVKDTNREIKAFRQQKLEIGARVKLPDGKEDVISEKMPDGTYKTKGGVLLTKDGALQMKINYVETFEEAEKLLGKEGTTSQSDIDPIAEILAFSEPEPKKAAKTKKTAQPVFVAKKGDKLIIPPGAAARNDFSFLKGCWRSKAVTYYNGFKHYQAPAELCFSGGNGGKFISYIDDIICNANTRARFSNGVLLIQAGTGPCKGRIRYAATMPRMFQCEGTGSQTECYILAKDDTDKRRKFKSRARFYKK